MMPVPQWSPNICWSLQQITTVSRWCEAGGVGLCVDTLVSGVRTLAGSSALAIAPCLVEVEGR